MTRLALLGLLALPLGAQTTFPKLCADPIPNTGGFGNLHLCTPTVDIYAGTAPPSSLLGKDGDLYYYNSGTVVCWMGPKLNGIWGGCPASAAGPAGPPGPIGPQGPAGPPGTGSASLPLIPCSSVVQPPAGTTVLVVTDAPVSATGAQIAQARCLAGFRVVTLDGVPVVPTASKSPDLLRQLNSVMAQVDGQPGYANWAVRTLRAGQ